MFKKAQSVGILFCRSSFGESVQYVCKSMSEKPTLMQQTKSSCCCFYTFRVISRLCSPSYSLQDRAPQTSGGPASPVPGWPRWGRGWCPPGWVRGLRPATHLHAPPPTEPAVSTAQAQYWSGLGGAAGKGLLLQTEASCYVL